MEVGYWQMVNNAVTAVLHKDLETELSQPHSEKMQVAVPAGCTGGETIAILRRGKQVHLTLPAQVKAGSTIEVDVEVEAAEDTDVSQQALGIELEEKQLQERLGMSSSTGRCCGFAKCCGFNELTLQR